MSRSSAETRCRDVQGLRPYGCRVALQINSCSTMPVSAHQAGTGPSRCRGSATPWLACYVFLVGLVRDKGHKGPQQPSGSLICLRTSSARFDTVRHAAQCRFRASVHAFFRTTGYVAENGERDWAQADLTPLDILPQPEVFFHLKTDQAPRQSRLFPSIVAKLCETTTLRLVVPL